MIVQTLELLGLQESVELIAAVAELDIDSVPPQLLEIAALCGRSVYSLCCSRSYLIHFISVYMYHKDCRSV